MARVTIEDCLKRVDNRFELVHMAAKRVRQLREGSEYLVQKAKNEDVVMALREIAAGKVVVKNSCRGRRRGLAGIVVTLERNKNYFRIDKSVGRAICKYGLIRPGERIAVGLSGGKDSLTMLHILNERRKWSPVPYSLHPIFVDPGFEGGFHEALSEWCAGLGLELTVDLTDHGIVAHSEENRRKSACFLCARLRRKRLFQISEDLDCRKMALGHNKDDIIETLFINMCYGGQIGSMVPHQEFFKGKFHIIRPMALVDEPRILKLTRDYPEMFPVFTNPCPSAGKTKRAELKEVLKDLYGRDRKIKSNLFRSMSNVHLDYLPGSVEVESDTDVEREDVA